LIIDVTEQRESLARLEAEIAHVDNWITQLVYLNNHKFESSILTKAEDLQIRLIDFRDIAEKYDFLLDQSLVEEVDPLFSELRSHINKLVRISSMDSKILSK
jgi:hypothetical protein